MEIARLPFQILCSLFNNAIGFSREIPERHESRELDSPVNRSRGDPWSWGNRSRFRSLGRSSDFDGGESSVGRKEAANLHRARHVRTRLTGMSFSSSYFTLLRATMIGLNAQAPLASKRIATAIVDANPKSHTDDSLHFWYRTPELKRRNKKKRNDLLETRVYVSINFNARLKIITLLISTL